MAPSPATIRKVLNISSVVAPPLAGRFAFRLFSEPLRRASVRPAELPVHEQARRESIDLDGIRVATYTWGDGARPVLFAHGFEARASCFASTLVPRLTELGYTAIAYDAPGHGDSAGKGASILDHHRVIQELHAQCGPFHAVVGHSFGVLCAFYALRNGVKTRCLVAISGASSFGVLPEVFCTKLALSPTLTGQLRLRTEKFFRPEKGIWELFSPDHRPEQIDVPVLVIHDENDPEMPLDEARRIATAYEGRSSLVTTRGLGHRRILADPSVAESVTDFITSFHD